MALIECPECKSEISDQADSCPKCGFSNTTVTGIAKQPPKRGIIGRMFSPKVYCPACGHTGKPGRAGIDAAGCLITLILLCFFIIPGIIYLIHIDSKSAKTCCKKCKNPNVIKV